MSFERIPYSSFIWKLGTTSFRTKSFNRMIEWQLRLLDDFWAKPEYHNLGWEIPVQGQPDIYEIKNNYYDWLVENGFTRGDDRVKYKAAREKTSGLLDMGFINREHRLTEVGYKLLHLTDNNGFLETNQLGISKDSEIYLQQLLKLGEDISGSFNRPLIIVLYLLSELDYLSYEEFKYLVPLCTSEETTSLIIDYIRQLRSNVNNIDSIIVDFLLSKDNYRNGISRFSENDFSEDLLLSVGMNRKSAAYDKSYVALYNEMHKVFMENDNTRIYALFESLSGAKFQSSIAIKWKSMFFDTTSSKAIRNNPEEHFLSLPNCITCSEQAFKRFFFKKMHLFKAKATLEDYFDLNRRYLGLTNCFLFSDGQVKLDIVPKQFFNSVIDELYELAYQRSGDLFRNTSLEEICPALSFNEQVIIDGINNDLNTSITTIDEAFNEVDRIRYERFNALINDKFSDESLIQLLSDFENRDDDRINSYITDNADIPTIFEYVLGVIWYKTSNKQGKVLDYMKLSLDANLLPVTHAAGGEADIVYEYRECSAYPAHNVLLEATLADSTNQRRMEMEPVSRHVGNHILNYGNTNSYGIFVTPYLHLNVISDFKSRKHTPYFDSQDEERYIPGMKITPLDTNDLKAIITSKIKYNQLYRKFEDAYQRSDSYPNPKKWYDETIKMHS